MNLSGQALSPLTDSTEQLQDDIDMSIDESAKAEDRTTAKPEGLAHNMISIHTLGSLCATCVWRLSKQDDDTDP